MSVDLQTGMNEMILSLEQIKGRKFRTQDGSEGRLEDIFVDITDWSVLYWVIFADSWLPGKRALVPGQSVNTPPDSPDCFRLDMTKEELVGKLALSVNEPSVRNRAQIRRQGSDSEPLWVSGVSRGNPNQPLVPGTRFTNGVVTGQEPDLKQDKTESHAPTVNILSAGDLLDLPILVGKEPKGRIHDVQFDLDTRRATAVVIRTDSDTASEEIRLDVDAFRSITLDEGVEISEYKWSQARNDQP